MATSKDTWHDVISVADVIHAGYDAKPPQAFPRFDTGDELDRTHYVTASEIGKCRRSVKFSKLAGGFVQPALWGYMERGKMIEAWAVAMIRYATTPVRFMFLGDAQRSFVADNRGGTPDGLALFRHDDEEVGVVLDFKSIDPRTNRNNLPRSYEVDQVQSNIDLVRENLANIVNARIVGGMLIYIDASNIQDITEIAFDVDEKRIAALKRKAFDIMNAETPEQLPADGMFYKDGCKNCDFTEKCSDFVVKERDHSAALKAALADAERVMKNVFKK